MPKVKKSKKTKEQKELVVVAREDDE